jgi:protein SMG8
LILFEKCGLSQEDLRDFADGDYSRGKRKRVPQKKLIDCMERQIINIFKNGRLIPEKTPTNLFKISEKNAFIFVLQPEESKINEECLPIPACLDLLKESIKVQRDVETAASDRSWLPKRRRAEDMWQEYDSWKSKLDQGEEVWNFLSVHIDIICGKSSRSRSRSQEPVELNQLLPVADILFRYIVEGKLPENIEEEESLKAHEMRETVLAKLQKALNPEWTFSDQRCGKLVPEAYKTYLTNLPSHYTTRIHNNQVDQALMIYHGYARGPAVKVCIIL